MGFVICTRCGGHYQLQKGEAPEDFESCECGGQLEYVEYLSDYSNSEKSHDSFIESSNDLNSYNESDDPLQCPNCGAPLSEYSIICRNCGAKREIKKSKPKTDPKENITNNNNVDVSTSSESYNIPEVHDISQIKETVDIEPIETLKKENKKEEKGKEEKKDNSKDKLKSADENKRKNTVNSPSPRFDTGKTEITEKIIICPSCEGENDSISNFCKFCGFELNNNSNNNNEILRANLPKPKKNSDTSKKTENSEEISLQQDTCPHCGAEVSEYSIICKICGKPINPSNNDYSFDNEVKSHETKNYQEKDMEINKEESESLINDFILIVSSLDFIKMAIALVLVANLAGPIIGPLFVSLCFLFFSMGFSLLSKQNTKISTEGGLVLGTIGVLSILVFNFIHNLSIFDFIFFIGVSVFGGFLGRQLIKRNLVK